MTMNDKVSDYISFPKTFESYRWYKPILVFIISFIITLILGALIVAVFYLIMGPDFIISIFKGGAESLNTSMNIFFTDLIIIAFIPSLYLASKIVKDRSFSSYSSSRGGWNFRLYFKALIIPVILYIIYLGAESLILGSEGTSHFSIAFLAVLLISVPLQCIAEEYIFRGIIMQTLGSWIGIPLIAIVIQAIIFTLGHGYDALGLLETLVLGIAYGFFAWKTNGIEISSALHTANNFSLGLFIMLGLEASNSSFQLYDKIGGIVYLIILCIIMYYLGKKTDWFGEIPEDSQNIGLLNF